MYDRHMVDFQDGIQAQELKRSIKVRERWNQKSGADKFRAALVFHTP
jgi:hypothetical protein